MSKKDGLRNVLAGILSENDSTTRPVTVPEQPVEPAAAPESPETPPEEPRATEKAARAPKAASQPIEVASARRGRPPGRKTSQEQTPKKKATLYLPPSLLDEYVNWSW